MLDVNHWRRGIFSLIYINHFFLANTIEERKAQINYKIISWDIIRENYSDKQHVLILTAVNMKENRQLSICILET